MSRQLSSVLWISLALVLAFAPGLSADDFPDTLPIGGFKITTPEGPRYIPDLVVHESALLLDFEDAESPVVGKLELSMSLGSETFHRNFEHLNANRAANGLPELQLQPFVTLQISMDLPGTVDPLVRGLVASSPDRQTSEVDLTSEQVVLVHSLNQQAGWLPQLAVSALVNGDFRPMARMEPVRHRTVRRARARTLRVLPPTGFSNQTMKLTLTQPEHGIEQVRLLTDTGADFPNLHAAPTAVQCEYATIPGFPNRFAFDFARWSDARLATFTVPIQVRSATITSDLFSSVPAEAIQFMALVFDSRGLARLIFVERPTNEDRSVSVLTVQGTTMKSGCLLGFNANGELHHILKMRVPGDLGTPSFRLAADGSAASLSDFLREKLDDRMIRAVSPLANAAARQELSGIAVELDFLTQQLEPLLPQLEAGNRDALIQYCAKLDSLRGNAAVAAHEGFAACCVASSIAYEFDEPTLESQQAALSVIQAQLGSQLAPSEQKIKVLIRAIFQRLIEKVRQSGGDISARLASDSTPDADLLRACFVQFPFLAAHLTEPADRFVVAAALAQSDLADDVLKGEELLQHNLADQHVQSVELLASVLVAGRSTNAPDFDRAVTVCQAGMALDSPVCHRLLGMLHKSQQIEGADLLTAITLFEKAADLEDLQAMIQLGYIFLDSEPPHDVDKALEWFTRAADEEPEAMVQAGLILQERNDPEFRQLFRRAAEQGFAAGQYQHALAIVDTAPEEEVTGLLRAAALRGHDPAAIEYTRRVAERLTATYRTLFESDTSASEFEQQTGARSVAQAIYSVSGPKATVAFLQDLPSQTLRDRTLPRFLSTFSVNVLVNRANLRYEHILQFADLVNDSTRLQFDMGLFRALLTEERFAEAFSLEQDKNIAGRAAPDDFSFSMGALVGNLVAADRFDEAIRLNKLFRDDNARESGWSAIIHRLLKVGQTDRANDLLTNNASALTRDKFAALETKNRFLAGDISHSQAIQQINDLGELPSNHKRQLFAMMAEEGFAGQSSLDAIRALLREAESLHGAAFRITEALAEAKEFDDALKVARDIPDVDSQVGGRDNPRREALGVVIFQLALNQEFARAKRIADDLPETATASAAFSQPVDRAAAYSSIARVELDAGKKQQSIQTLRKAKQFLVSDSERAVREAFLFMREIPKTGDIALLNAVWAEFNPADNERKPFFLMETHAHARRYTEAETLLNSFSGDLVWGARLTLCSRQFDNGDYDICRESLLELPSLEASDGFGLTFDRRDRVIAVMADELLHKAEFDTALAFTELMQRESAKLQGLRRIYMALKQAQQTPATSFMMRNIESRLLSSADATTVEGRLSAMTLLFEQARASWGRGDYESLLRLVDELAHGAALADNDEALSTREQLSIVSSAIIHLETLRKQERTLQDYLQSLYE